MVQVLLNTFYNEIYMQLVLAGDIVLVKLVHFSLNYHPGNGVF